jgi:hypothetical protein
MIDSVFGDDSEPAGFGDLFQRPVQKRDIFCNPLIIFLYFFAGEIR